jgi:hypothetical protein
MVNENSYSDVRIPSIFIEEKDGNKIIKNLISMDKNAN